MSDKATISSPSALGGNFYVNEQTGMFDVAGMRPFVNERGQAFITVNGQNVPVANASLRKDQWISLDNRVRQVATERLNGIAELISRGLTYNAGDIGTTIVEWDAASDMTDAEINMSGVAQSEKDTQNFELNGVPVPIVHKDFTIDARRLLASRRNGQGLDMTQAATASRLVSERSEMMLFNGAGVKSNGRVIHGYTTHPQRVTQTIATSWNDAGADILGDVEAMLKNADEAMHYGPFVLYVSKDYWAQLRGDYKAESERTYLDRLRAYAEISDVKVSDKLAANTAVLVQMTEDVVDLAIAQDISTIQWQSGDTMQQHFKVMAAWVPRIKADYNDRLGIVHATTA